MTMKPSAYWRRQVFATFQDDVPGVRTRDLIGVENLMWASDYPHGDATWPHSREALARNFAGVPEEERDRMIGGNMARAYQLRVAAA